MDMTTIDFEHFCIPAGIGSGEVQTGDVRESFANVIYKAGTGIRAHALALKIYGSKGATEYDDDEVALMRQMTARYCTPGFIDGLEMQIKNNEKTENKEA